MRTTCVETRPNRTLLLSVNLIFICLSTSQFYLKCLFTFVTWSCRHLADSSWCSPSGKGRRRRFCRPSGHSLHSQSLWHHFLDTAGRWGNPRRTALAAPNRKAGRLCWTLGGGGAQRYGGGQWKSKGAVWRCRCNCRRWKTWKTWCWKEDKHKEKQPFSTLKCCRGSAGESGRQ